MAEYITGYRADTKTTDITMDIEFSITKRNKIIEKKVKKTYSKIIKILSLLHMEIRGIDGTD